MTMPTDAAQPPRQEYVENGVTTLHNIPFKFIDADDIWVYRTLVDGTEILLVQPTDYTVAGGNYDTGSITKANAGVDGATLRIDRNTKRGQFLDYIQGDDFSAESHEHGLDRLTMIVQELKRDALTPEQVRDIIAQMIKGSAGIGIEVNDAADTLTIINLYDAEFIRDTIGAALMGAGGIEVIPNDGSNTITIINNSTSVALLADFLMLSGDQQGGGETGTGEGFAEQVLDIVAGALAAVGLTINYDDPGGAITITNTIDAEFIRDTIAAALVAAAGIEITPNDAGDQIVIGAPNAGVSLEDVRDMLATCLVPGTNIAIVPNDAGDQIVISTTALDPSYRGIIPTDVNADFDFSDAMGGRARQWTGAAGTATLRLESAVALSAGWVMRIRNKGTGNLAIVREAGVALYKNGSTVNAGAILAPGGTATIERWAADEFTITGPGVS